MVRTSFRSIIDKSSTPVLGCFTSLEPNLPAQIVGRAGFDFVIIDMEHSPYSAKTAVQYVHTVVAASGGKCVPLVRIPSHGVEWVKWALDSGAAGIVIPMVQTKEEMEAIIDRAIYPPGGSRSFGPLNAAYAELDPTSTMFSYFDTAKDLAIIPIIESVKGVENVEAIFSVKGVSACFIGPFDLMLSTTHSIKGMGDPPEASFQDSVKKVIAAGKKLDVPVGCLGGGEAICKKRTELGMDFLLCGSDGAALASGLATQIAAAKTGINKAKI